MIGPLSAKGWPTDDAALARHLDDYRRLLLALRDHHLDVHGARAAVNLADDLPALLRPAAGHEDGHEGDGDEQPP